MPSEHTFAVDRIHEADAVLVDDNGKAFTVPLAQLPGGLEERTVLRASLDASGVPDWSTAAVDRDETERRRRRSGEISDKLAQSDEHGFLHSDE